MKKSSSKHTKLAVEYLQQIQQLLTEQFGGHVGLAKDDDPLVYSMVSSDVTIFYTEEDNHFFVTFKVGISGKRAGEITKLICLILKYAEFTMLEDSYFDDTSERLVFGADAVEKKQEFIRQVKGQCKCPVCEGVYQKKYFKNGYCLNCDDIKDQIIFH